MVFGCGPLVACGYASSGAVSGSLKWRHRIRKLVSFIVTSFIEEVTMCVAGRVLGSEVDSKEKYQQFRCPIFGGNYNPKMAGLERLKDPFTAGTIRANMPDTMRTKPE
eukprot:6197791-Pleurochrysis_carterae.AAC.1